MNRNQKKVLKAKGDTVKQSLKTILKMLEQCSKSTENAMDRARLASAYYYVEAARRYYGEK